MLINAFKVLVNNLFKKNFYKKKLIFWQLFLFPIKVVLKLY